METNNPMPNPTPSPTPEIDWQVTVADGKYTLQHFKNGGGKALRYGEEWPQRDVIGDNMMFALGVELIESQEKNASLELRLNEALAKLQCTMGVGTGDGRLFVHGDSESIRAAQAIVLRMEQAEQTLSTAQAVIKNDCETEELVKALARQHLTELEVEGDSNAVPNEADIVESLCKKLAVAEQELKTSKSFNSVTNLLDQDEWKKLKEQLIVAEKSRDYLSIEHSYAAEELLQLCYEIEKLPASEQQTKISIMASTLRSKLSNNQLVPSLLEQLHSSELARVKLVEAVKGCIKKFKLFDHEKGCGCINCALQQALQDQTEWK